MNSIEKWTLQIDAAVYKFLKKVPRGDAERISFIINNEFPKSPFLGDIRKMGGEHGVWRRRAGAYRIKFEVFKEERVVHIFRVERRGSKTY